MHTHERTLSLEGKVALVTGAGSGIGRATAIAMARAGARTVAVGRRAAPLDETARLGPDDRIASFAGDMTREDEVVRAVAFARDRFGRLDAVCHAAGATFPMGLVHELPSEAFRAWIDGHLVSSFLVAKHGVRAMLESGGGSLILVGTFVGHSKALPGTSGYAAAKTGLFGLMRTVAAEYATRSIRANLLIVGGTDTPMGRAWNDDDPDKLAWAAGLHVMQRLAQPEEIAAAAAFLASDAASFVTGAPIPVEGGVSLT
jgi:NAD(P)-dependent dehydrogenase (short-subunit alcohol dehydrogenase family)